MTTTTLITLSPDELQAVINAALHPLIEELGRMRAVTGPKKDLLSIEDVAELSGFHPQTVRGWILEGRKMRNGKIVKLRVVDDLSARHSIRPAQWDAFMSNFRDVTI
nr:hypothetical protein [uncultured Arsenicibacter sp.]